MIDFGPDGIWAVMRATDANLRLTKKLHYHSYICTSKEKSIDGHMLGAKMNLLLAADALVQIKVNGELEADTAYMTTMESNEKPVSRQHLKKLSVLLGIAEEELLTLWLADKLYDIAKDEPVGLKAMGQQKKY